MFRKFLNDSTVFEKVSSFEKGDSVASISVHVSHCTFLFIDPENGVQAGMHG